MKNKLGVKNPLIEDFSVNYDLSGLGQPKTYTLKGLEIDFFEPVIAEHLKKHLVNAIINKRGVKVNRDADAKEIYKEISISI